MTEERISPLRARMIEDMRICGMGEKAQKFHIRAIKDFAKLLGRSPDMPEDLREYQLHMTDTGVTPSTFDVRIVALRFFFGMTCGCEDMKRYMQFHTQPRKLPLVFSVEEVSDILMAAPGPGLKYRAALSISYGAGLRAAEVCNLKIGDIDSDRMQIHVDQRSRGDTTHPAQAMPLLRRTHAHHRGLQARAKTDVAHHRASRPHDKSPVIRSKMLPVAPGRPGPNSVRPLRYGAIQRHNRASACSVLRNIEHGFGRLKRQAHHKPQT